MKLHILAEIFVWVFLMSFLGVFGKTVDKIVIDLKERTDALSYSAWKLE
ncbi:MAG: hypothetical protein AAF513_09345 [Pseudomonadota bacterium]